MLTQLSHSICVYLFSHRSPRLCPIPAHSPTVVLSRANEWPLSGTFVFGLLTHFSVRFRFDSSAISTRRRTAGRQDGTDRRTEPHGPGVRTGRRTAERTALPYRTRHVQRCLAQTVCKHKTQPKSLLHLPTPPHISLSRSLSPALSFFPLTQKAFTSCLPFPLALPDRN